MSQCMYACVRVHRVMHACHAVSADGIESALLARVCMLCGKATTLALALDKVYTPCLPEQQQTVDASWAQVETDRSAAVRKRRFIV